MGFNVDIGFEMGCEIRAIGNAPAVVNTDLRQSL
jgi:hypothetical protein